MALLWGGMPLMMEASEGAEAMEQQAIMVAGQAGLIRKGDVVVLTAGLPLHVPGTTNTVKVAVVGSE